MILTLFAILVAALVTLGVVAGFVPRVATAAGTAGICGLAVVLAAMVLANGAGPTTLVLPIGPPDTAVRLALDPLAASFALLVFLVMPCAAAAPLPLAAMAITVLAGDSFTLAAGLLLLGGTTFLRCTAAAAACLIVAFALAGALGDFAAIRAAPPEGYRAAAVLLLVLVGAGALSRVNTTLSAYLVLRVLFDLCGQGQPLWWGVPLLLAGAAIATIGSLRAALADTLQTVLPVAPLPLFGMAATALGVALFGRAVDLPSVTSQALDAAWLALVCHALCRALLARCADAAESGAGTRRLDRLGGLIHRMPVTAGSCLVGLFAIAFLPPGLGFAAFWLVFQSLLAAARIGEFGVQLLILCVTALTALSAGMAALAAVRLFGVVFLGRPRTPRAAVAEEAPRPVRFVLGGLAALAALLGVLPAFALLPAGGWTLATGTISFVTLRPGADMPGYSAIAVAGLFGVAAIAVSRAFRRTGQQQREPAWSGGFDAPPPWLPFGDPATQFGPASFIEPLRRALMFLPPILAVRRHLVRWGEAMLRVANALLVP